MTNATPLSCSLRPTPHSNASCAPAWAVASGKATSANFECNQSSMVAGCLPARPQAGLHRGSTRDKRTRSSQACVISILAYTQKVGRSGFRNRIFVVTHADLADMGISETTREIAGTPPECHSLQPRTCGMPCTSMCDRARSRSGSEYVTERPCCALICVLAKARVLKRRAPSGTTRHGRRLKAPLPTKHNQGKKLCLRSCQLPIAARAPISQQPFSATRAPPQARASRARATLSSFLFSLQYLFVKREARRSGCAPCQQATTGTFSPGGVHQMQAPIVPDRPPGLWNDEIAEAAAIRGPMPGADARSAAVQRRPPYPKFALQRAPARVLAARAARNAAQDCMIGPGVVLLRLRDLVRRRAGHMGAAPCGHTVCRIRSHTANTATTPRKAAILHQLRYSLVE